MVRLSRLDVRTQPTVSAHGNETLIRAGIRRHLIAVVTGFSKDDRQNAIATSPFSAAIGTGVVVSGVAVITGLIAVVPLP